MRTVTLKDIAQHTGLSEMTVSRALRGLKHVSAKTRQKVEAAADELGYQPDPMLSALVNYRISRQTSKEYNKIAVVSAWSMKQDWPIKDRSGQAIIRGINEGAEQCGFEIELFRLAEYENKISRLQEALRHRGIEAIILLPLPIPYPVGLDKDLKAWNDFIIVRVENAVGHPHCNYVWTDHFTSAVILWDQLWKRGYRRIGLELSNESALRIHGIWEAAFRLKQSGEEVSKADRLLIYRYKTRSKANFLAYLEANQPDAMIGRSQCLMDWAKEAGYDVPETFGFVSFDCHNCREGTAGIRQRRREIGQTAVNLVHRLKIERKFGETNFNRGVIIPGTWQDGITVRQIKDDT